MPQILDKGNCFNGKQSNGQRTKGVQYYDLCVIEPERLPHIAQFKMGFTKELIPFYCISKKSLYFRVINKLQNVFFKS